MDDVDLLFSLGVLALIAGVLGLLGWTAEAVGRHLRRRQP